MSSCSRYQTVHFFNLWFPVKQSIKRFVEDQAFLRPYDSTPWPLSPVASWQVVSLSHSFCVLPVMLTGRGGGGSQITVRKPGPL